MCHKIRCDGESLKIFWFSGELNKTLNVYMACRRLSSTAWTAGPAAAHGLNLFAHMHHPHIQRIREPRDPYGSRPKSNRFVSLTLPTQSTVHRDHLSPSLSPGRTGTPPPAPYPRPCVSDNSTGVVVWSIGRPSPSLPPSLGSSSSSTRRHPSSWRRRKKAATYKYPAPPNCPSLPN